jgi:hypothetical protein
MTKSQEIHIWNKCRDIINPFRSRLMNTRIYTVESFFKEIELIDNITASDKDFLYQFCNRIQVYLDDLIIELKN